MVRFRPSFLAPNFLELRACELRRILLPRTPVNKARTARKGHASIPKLVVIRSPFDVRTDGRERR